MTPRISLRDQNGQTLPIVAVFMVCIVALAGLTIDVSNLLHVRAQMQSAADASATAGADDLLSGIHPSITDATDTAVQYGMAANGQNQVRGVVRTSVVQNVQVGCDDTYGACNYPDEPNTVDVKDSADVPLFFLGIFGIAKAKVSVEAEACAPCSAEGHDIVLVLDHTGSMADKANASNNRTKIDNLKAALLQGLLPSLDPDLDNVSLVIFPPTTPVSPICNEEDNWTATTQATDPYLDPNHQYLVEPLVGGFLSENGGLISSSPLVQDINCLVPEGHTDYMDPLAVAKQELDDDGRTNVQKDVVLISDGAADFVENPSCERGAQTPLCLAPCEDGIQEASALKDEGIDIWAIAYGEFGNDLPCKVSFSYSSQPFEPSGMDGYTAMSQIASSGDYLADPDPAQLGGILHTVAGSLSGQTGSRLVK